jgi:predicted metallo-beta-lactamase superfamily hydrolase
MEMFIVIKVQTDREAREIANEVRANLEYEGVTVESIAASASLSEAVMEAVGAEAK